jgi:glycosyltransferase involved in cell wall biosynthesis
MENTIQVSVVIRTFNEERHIGLLLDALKSQVFDQKQIEILVVDSGSTDDTIKIVKNYELRLFEIPKKEFTYSRALNIAIQNSIGDYIVILSAHAIPTSMDWLKGMISHFTSKEIAGVYCRQVPWPDAPWDEVIRIKKTFPTQSCSFFLKDKIDDLYFSNAASCISKKLWQKHPFEEVPAAEDRLWALWAIENNYKIIYDAMVSVRHSHNESPRESAQRLIQIERSIDIKEQRKRNLFLTVQNAMGLCLRDSMQILYHPECKSKRLVSIYHSFCRALWYIMDFK